MPQPEGSALPFRPALPAIGITALGVYAPEKVVTNADFEQHLDTSDEWIFSRTGIRERRFAAENEYTSHMGVRAVQDLVRRFPHALEGVDAVVCATGSPDALFPSTAALIAGQVGLRGAAAFDVSAACSGFVYACSVAQGLVAGGSAKKVLLVGAETMSKIVDQTDRGTAILFGDGGGAMIIEAVPSGYGFESFVLGADSAGAESLYVRCVAHQLPSGAAMQPYLAMNGREVFKFAVRVMGESGHAAMQKAGLSVKDVDWLIPHQANIRIIESACQRFGLSLDKTVVNLDRYGNTSAATIPLALAEAYDDGRIQDGQQLLMIAFGGGLSWGATTLKWYDPLKHAGTAQADQALELQV
ncbi:ketoacyl-ACP synthase III [Deinococcus detaillensis]|uniref:Beta-ketoacyl-[acyl-carrier-protein] synthase III n=1 Tax=Deinococcus detaillensis TaxID=2592048 RepID=A0A553V6I0_9DEIO|nr:beta-ketoacyl-ACP synthase III [Deinococcus detaillensis]TSA88083.1 ketoacyl-ACP synthase III [Deinococcus detaillensis]